MRFTEVMPGAAYAVAWGEPNGGHGGFTRVKVGYKVPMHSHTFDVRMVVVSGALIFGDSGGAEARLEPGSYCFVPGGARHTIACAPGVECLFYEEQLGKFDLKLAR